VPTNATLTAGQLRKLADALDLIGDTPLTAHLFLSEASYGPEPDRVATIDTIAGALGVTAKPAKEGSTWSHIATDERDGVYLRVGTYIKAPAQRCACGAECTHNPAGAR
jgi:hypothetical protein